MFTKKISAVAAAITAATALAVVNPSVADAATNYPKINRDYVSYSTDGETVVCGGSVNQDMFRCQTTAKWVTRRTPTIWSPLISRMHLEVGKPE